MQQEGILTASDFMVGGVLTIYARGFELLDADEATLLYMESEPMRFPHADFDKVKTMWRKRHSGSLRSLPLRMRSLHRCWPMCRHSS